MFSKYLIAKLSLIQKLDSTFTLQEIQAKFWNTNKNLFYFTKTASLFPIILIDSVRTIQCTNDILEGKIKVNSTGLVIPPAIKLINLTKKTRLTNFASLLF